MFLNKTYYKFIFKVINSIFIHNVKMVIIGRIYCTNTNV